MDNLDIIDMKNRIKKIDNVRVFINADIRTSIDKRPNLLDESFYILALEHIDSFYLLKDLFFDEKDLILKQERYNDSPYSLYDVRAITKDNKKISIVFVGKESLFEYLKNIPSYTVIYDKDKMLFAGKNHLDQVNMEEEFNAEKFKEDGISFFVNIIEVAASLSRRDLIVANYQFDVCKSQLLDLVRLYIYLKYEKKVLVGKKGQEISRHLDEEYLKMLKESFNTAKLESFWSSTFTLASLYRKLGLDVARKEGYEYPKKEDVDTMNYLRFLYDNFGRNAL